MTDVWFGLTLCALALGLLWGVSRWERRDRPDPEWKPTGVKPIPPEWKQYDYDKAIAGKKRAAARAVRVRKTAAGKLRLVKKPSATVIRMERKA